MAKINRFLLKYRESVASAVNDIPMDSTPDMSSIVSSRYSGRWMTKG